MPVKVPSRTAYLFSKKILVIVERVILYPVATSSSTERRTTMQVRNRRGINSVRTETNEHHDQAEVSTTAGKSVDDR